MSPILSLLSFLVANYYTTFTSSQQVCLSDECRYASQLIQNNLDTSVDPCVDMYQFACAGWKRHNDVPMEYMFWSPLAKLEDKLEKQLVEILEEDGWLFKGTNSTAVRKVKQFYKSCVDDQAMEDRGAKALKKLIDAYGSWTVTETSKSWDERSWRLQEALQRSHNLTGNSFFKMNIKKDKKNTSRNVIYIVQGGLTLQDYVDGYKKFMRIANNVGHLLGGFNKKKMNQVFHLESKLSKIFTRHKDQHSVLMNLTKFQKLIGPWINIMDYMTAIFGNDVMTPDDEIVVSTPGYFRKLNNVILNANKEVLANYIMWNLIQPTLSYLPGEFPMVNLYASRSVRGMNSLEPLQKKCLLSSKKWMPFVTSAIYVDRHFSQETIVKVVVALEEIEQAFIQNLNQLSWLDKATKRNLKEKVQAINNQVGYPDWISDPIKLDARYEDLVIEEGEYFRNFIHCTEYHANFDKRMLKQAPSRNTWHFYPHDVNAYYYAPENQVGVMAGILQEPIVSKDYPKSFLYGVMGSILGHEIIHAFDTGGRMYDKDGNFRDNWTPHVAKVFNRKAQCFVDQYNKYIIYGENISGSLTLAENIADNGGVKMAYRAYKSSIGSNGLRLPGLNLTNDQLFFVGFSSIYCSTNTEPFDLTPTHERDHAHEEFRIKGTLSNSREFSEAFNCPVNSFMNPAKKCEIW